MPTDSFQAGEIRTLDEVIEEHMLHAIRVCNGNIAEAARLLDIGRSTLYRRLSKIRWEKRRARE